MVTKKELKKNIISSLVNAALPDILAGVGEGVSQLKYEKKEGDNRGFLRRGVGMAVGNIKQNFSARNMATAFMSPTMRMLTHTLLDLRKEKQDGSEQQEKSPKEKNEKKMGIPTEKVQPVGNDKDVELLDGNSDEYDLYEEMIVRQDETIELLKHIDENTKPNRLKDREAEIEARNQKRQGLSLGLGDGGKDGKRGGLGSIAAAALGGTIKDMVMSAVAGWFGLKGAKALIAPKLSGAKGFLGGLISKGGSAIASGAKAAGGALKGAPMALLKGGKGIAGLLGGGAAMAVAQPTITNALTKNTSTVSNVTATTNATKEIVAAEKAAVAAKTATNPSIVQNVRTAGSSAMKSIGGFASGLGNSVTTKMGSIFSSGTVDSAKKIGTTILEKSKSMGAAGLGFLGKLSTPLTVGSTLLEANEVRENKDLTETQKNIEYTKIGSRLAGMWAGAKAGAWAGAGLGGAAGTVVPGLGNAAGAAGGGIIGALAGAYGGYKLGDSVGDTAGKSFFGDETKTVKVENIYGSKASPESVADQLGADYSKLPNTVANFLLGKDSTLSYDDVKGDYKKYLDSNGLKVSDETALRGMTIAKHRAIARAVDIFQLEKLSKEVEKPVSTFNVNNLTNPQKEITSYDSLGTGETRTTALGTLSQEMEKNHMENSKPQVVTQPVVIQQGNNSGSVPQQTENRNGNVGVPDTRNTDGTIQRLLDLSFSPLLR